MDAIQQQKKILTPDGYKIVHNETSAAMVIRPDGTTLEKYIEDMGGSNSGGNSIEVNGRILTLATSSSDLRVPYVTSYIGSYGTSTYIGGIDASRILYRYGPDGYKHLQLPNPDNVDATTAYISSDYANDILVVELRNTITGTVPAQTQLRYYEVNLKLLSFTEIGDAIGLTLPSSICMTKSYIITNYSIDMIVLKDRTSGFSVTRSVDLPNPAGGDTAGYLYANNNTDVVAICKSSATQYTYASGHEKSYRFTETRILYNTSTETYVTVANTAEVNYRGGDGGTDEEGRALYSASLNNYARYNDIYHVWVFVCRVNTVCDADTMEILASVSSEAGIGLQHASIAMYNNGIAIIRGGNTDRDDDYSILSLTTFTFADDRTVTGAVTSGTMNGIYDPIFGNDGRVTQIGPVDFRVGYMIITVLIDTSATYYGRLAMKTLQTDTIPTVSDIYFKMSGTSDLFYSSETVGGSGYFTKDGRFKAGIGMSNVHGRNIVGYY